MDQGLPYLQIPLVVEKTLNTIAVSKADSLDVILEVDAQARAVAQDYIRTL